MSKFSIHKKVLTLTVGFIAAIALFAGCAGKFERVLFSLVPHPQTPKKRPYKIEKVAFINPVDGTRIVGELTYPSTGEKFPGLVLVAGESSEYPPAERDNDITGHKYFLVISDLLTKRGYAVLRYDNRGVGESSGEYATATDNEFASDAAAALKWLRRKSSVKLVSSGFLGHSQGGIKSLMAASAEKPDVIVSLAGVRIQTMAEVIIQQNKDIDKAKGVSPSIAEQRTRELTDIFEIIRISKDQEEVRTKLRQYCKTEGLTDPKQIKKVVDELGSAWWFAEAHRDVRPLAENHDGPVLALFGSKDLLVSASINEGPTRELLRHPKSETFTFQGLNHLFQEAEKGIGPEEYWEIETTIEERVIEKIDTWLKSI